MEGISGSGNVKKELHQSNSTIFNATKYVINNSLSEFYQNMIIVLMILLTAFRFIHFGGAIVPKTGSYSKTTFNLQLAALFFVIVIINQKRNCENINTLRTWLLNCLNARSRGLTFRHRASCIQGQAFCYSPENAFYIFNQQIYFIN